MYINKVSFHSCFKHVCMCACKWIHVCLVRADVHGEPVDGTTWQQRSWSKWRRPKKHKSNTSLVVMVIKVVSVVWSKHGGLKGNVRHGVHFLVFIDWSTRPRPRSAAVRAVDTPAHTHLTPMISDTVKTPVSTHTHFLCYSCTTLLRSSSGSTVADSAWPLTSVPDHETLVKAPDCLSFSGY